MSSDRPTTPSLEEFFAGVDDARAHLERHSHAARPLWERLRRLAGELLKPRASDELIVWLCEQLHRALGARGLAIWVFRDGWLLGHQAGKIEGTPVPPVTRDLVSSAKLEPTGSEGTLWIGLRGMGPPVAAVWIWGAPPLEGQTPELLLAVCDTAGLLLEQALAARDLGGGAEPGQNEPIEK